MQVPILPECVHSELFLCLLELDTMGAPPGLDGNERHQLAAGLYRAGSHLSKGRLDSPRQSVEYLLIVLTPFV